MDVGLMAVRRRMEGGGENHVLGSLREKMRKALQRLW